MLIRHHRNASEVPAQDHTEGVPPGPTPAITARRRPHLLLLLGVLACIAWSAGCSAPGPLNPERPPESGTCGTPLPTFNPLADGLARVGTDTTLDLATWNLEFFPLDLPGDYDCPHPVDATRTQAAANIINAVGLDIIAIQEISDTTGFNQLVALCPGYGGLSSPEVRGCNYQRPGLLYRKDQVTVRSSRLLFTEDEYSFPRSPLQADLTITSNRRSYDLRLIIVHLKASGDYESLLRRRAASARLKTYLDQQAALDPAANYMVAGDWNDAIDDPLTFSAFPDFMGDTGDYQFLDMSMAGRTELASYPSFGGTLIDHLLVNRAACPDFSGGRITTLRLDQVVSGYGNVSDHRPVVVQAPVFR